MDDDTRDCHRTMNLPANQRKLDVVEELAVLAEQSGMSLIDLALAWAINHPGVTSAIIGPRTMEQLESQLTGADVTLTWSDLRIARSTSSRVGRPAHGYAHAASRIRCRHPCGAS